MGRLFWKILLALWAALLLCSALAALMAWIARPSFTPPPLAGGPGAELMLSTAAGILEADGPTALRRFAAAVQAREPGLHLHAVDVHDHDLLSDKPSRMDVQALAEARRRTSASAPARTPERPRLTQEVRDQAGERYLLYLDHASGPPAPPGPWYPEHRGPHPGDEFPWFLLAAGLLASLSCSALLAWHLSKPIRHLRQALQAAAQGRLETRVQPLMGKRRDELADLGQDFDRMSTQLQSLMQTQQRLLHDVSHELRSPLARLQAALSLVRQNPSRLGQTLERADLEIHRLDALVGELLMLARIENEPGHLAMRAEVDLAELLGAIVDDARFEAAPLGKRIALTSDAAVLEGNAELLHRALENIIRNAVRHSAPGSSIDIDLSATASEILVEVGDCGPGVLPSELERIFEPFYRSEASAGKSGSGLGLAIARRAIVAHGGSIVASNRSGGGLKMSIRLPR